MWDVRLTRLLGDSTISGSPDVAVGTVSHPTHAVFRIGGRSAWIRMPPTIAMRGWGLFSSGVTNFGPDSLEEFAFGTSATSIPEQLAAKEAAARATTRLREDGIVTPTTPPLRGNYRLVTINGVSPNNFQVQPHRKELKNLDLNSSSRESAGFEVDRVAATQPE